MATELVQTPEGVHGGPLSASKEVLEYEKILSIRDQIFSGNHPRLKVPQHVIRNFTPRSVQSPTLPTTPSAPAETTTSAQKKEGQQPSSAQRSPTVNKHAVAMVTGTTSAPPASSLVSAATTASSSKPASEIDPIFLIKSDGLIRAEIQLQRQRIERALRDQAEQKRIEAKLKPSPQELRPDFDVAEVLAKALELVKPIPEFNAEGANGNIAASDSFDENSYYSSKAPDSPQNEPSVASPVIERQTQAVVIDDAGADSDIARDQRGTRQLEQGNRGFLNGAAHPSSFEKADHHPARDVDNNTSFSSTAQGSRKVVQEESESLEEPEYSPPGPNVQSRRQSGAHHSFSEHANGAQGSYRPVQDSPRQQYSNHDVRVVRNHITSPAAPQPSRVSPLAFSRVSGIPGGPRQNRRQRKGDKRAAARVAERTSPDVPVQPIVARKRRREQEYKDSPRAVDVRRPVSPEVPYIKPEPVSPPPFIEVPSPAYVRSRIPQNDNAYIEIDSPRYTPVGERRDSGHGGFYEDRHNRNFEVEAVTNVNIPRSASRLTYKRPLREEHDLRRVATFQHARQSEIIRDYPEPIPDAPRYVRAASYAVTDRPLQIEKPTYYDEFTAPYPKTYTTDVRPASPRVREELIEPRPELRAMAPPPQRRIVIDADGNRYYESAGALTRIAPPVTRLAQVEPYDEAPSIRAAPVRGVSVIETPYSERRYVQDMPPPPITYRRVQEYTRVAPSDHGIYDREVDDRARAPRGASVQVVDYPARHPTYVDEPAYPREELVRMSSVRPPPSRYEDPGEPPVRMQSVRPVRREVSVYVDDEPRQSREYMPLERVSYPAPRQIRDERYFDDEETARLGLEGGQGMARRVSRRFQ